MGKLRYSIFDPTGNITALVESETPACEQPAVGALLMRRHPEVEQVGFVRFSEDGPVLRMAGGEFCGNASMSAAALFRLRTGRGTPAVFLRVSGAAGPVEVRLRREEDGGFSAGVRMPAALSVRELPYAFGTLRGTLPTVRMQGISHLVITPESPFFSLLGNRDEAERAVRAFCETLLAQGLGLMFLDGDALTPLVYIPGSGTVFWEKACASGSAAAGMALAAKSGAPVSLALREPGGCLRVESDPIGGQTLLWGRTRLTGEYQIEKPEL